MGNQAEISKTKPRALMSGVRLALMFILLAAGVGVLAKQNPLTGVKQAQQRQTAEPLTTDEIRAAEQQLAELGYWTGPVDGDFDTATKHALMAFQKVEGRKPAGALTRVEFAALLLAKRPLPRENHYAHIEIDLTRQILFFVDDQRLVSHILPISSGNGKFFTSEGYTRRAITPTGKFTVCRKIEGWRKSPLGLLFYPNYICGGVAIHGSLSIPVTPASHGCIRIPMFAAKEFSKRTPIGTIVVVHNQTPEQSNP